MTSDLAQEREMVAITAAKYGLSYTGHQEEPGGPGYWLITDPETRGTFDIPVGIPLVSLAMRRELQKLRARFARQGLEMAAARGHFASEILLEAVEYAEAHG